jgi:hypothetical protein
LPWHNSTILPFSATETTLVRTWIQDTIVGVVAFAHAISLLKQTTLVLVPLVYHT